MVYNATRLRVFFLFLVSLFCVDKPSVWWAVKMYSAWNITEMQLNGLNGLEQITVLFWVDYS